MATKNTTTELNNLIKNFNLLQVDLIQEELEEQFQATQFNK